MKHVATALLCLASLLPAQEQPKPAPLPTQVDLRESIDRSGLGPRSQGRRPTCSVFTVISVLEITLAKATGTATRLSPEYANRAKNLVIGRDTDGGFFHDILAGLAAHGAVRESSFPYARSFDPKAAPAVTEEDLAKEASALRETIAQRLRVVWVKPWSNSVKGLDAAQFDTVRRTLAAGIPVATGMAHSRTLVGYRDDDKVPGGGIFLTLDSGVGRYAEVSYEFVRSELFDVFFFEILPEPVKGKEKGESATPRARG